MEKLNELKMGKWQGMYEEGIENEYQDEWEILSKSPHMLCHQCCETLQELQDRVISGFNRICNNEVIISFV